MKLILYFDLLAQDHGELQVDDIVQASAARGNFALRPGNTPVVLLCAGIDLTPMLAMLHALAAQSSTRDICGYTERVAAGSIPLSLRHASLHICR